MKFIQTDNQIDIRMNGGNQLVMAVIFAAIGVVIAIVGMRLPNNAHSQTTVSPDGATTSAGAHAGPILLAFGSVFLIVGIVIGLLARSRRTIIIKGGDTTVSARRILGGSPESKSFPTASIKSVRLNSYMTGNNTSSSGGGRQSTVSVVLTDNSIVDVAVKSGGNFSVNGINMSALISKPPLTSEATKLSQFLGVPLESTDMSSVSGMINTVRNAWESGDPQTAPQRIEEAFTHGTITPTPVAPSNQQIPTPTSSGQAPTSSQDTPPPSV